VAKLDVVTFTASQVGRDGRRRGSAAGGEAGTAKARWIRGEDIWTPSASARPRSFRAGEPGSWCASVRKFRRCLRHGRRACWRAGEVAGRAGRCRALWWWTVRRAARAPGGGTGGPLAGLAAAQPARHRRRPLDRAGGWPRTRRALWLRPAPVGRASRAARWGRAPRLSCCCTRATVRCSCARDLVSPPVSGRDKCNKSARPFLSC
jgi:hypothetical protein